MESAKYTLTLCGSSGVCHVISCSSGVIWAYIDALGTGLVWLINQHAGPIRHFHVMVGRHDEPWKAAHFLPVSSPPSPVRPGRFRLCNLLLSTEWSVRALITRPTTTDISHAYPLTHPSLWKRTAINGVGFPKKDTQDRTYTQSRDKHVIQRLAS